MRPLVLLALLTLPLPPAAAQGWEIDLIDDATVTWFAPRRIEGGTVVGLGSVGGSDPLPVVFDGAQNTVLPLLAGDDQGEAVGTNAAGLVVGTSIDVVPMGQLTFFFTHAALWQGGQVTRVSDLVQSGPSLELFESIDVNSAGRIVGVGRDASVPALRAWTLENGQLVDLTPGTSASITQPVGINDAGQVAGTQGGPDHAFLWTNGTFVDLHVASGIAGVVSRAYALSETGVVVGSADFVAGGPQWETAAIWRDGSVLNLGTFGGNQSSAWGVNSRMEVVGTSTTGANELRAFLWAGGVLHDLNDLVPAGSGWTLLVARSIDEDGTITGEGAFGGALHTFVARPACGSCLSYCVSLPNSTGTAATISATGWESVSANHFGLRAEGLPAGQNGLFFYGADPVQIPLGTGFRCVGGPALYRLPVTAASAAGVLAAELNLRDVPSPPGSILAGATWSFQAWFRDPAAGASPFNLSDGLTVTFAP